MSLLNRILSVGLLYGALATPVAADVGYRNFTLDLYFVKIRFETLETKTSREVTHSFLDRSGVCTSRYFSKYQLHRRCPPRLVEALYEYDFNADGVMDLTKKITVSGAGEVKSEAKGDFNCDGQMDYHELCTKSPNGSSTKFELVDKDKDGIYETVNETRVEVEAKK